MPQGTTKSNLKDSILLKPNFYYTSVLNKLRTSRLVHFLSRGTYLLRNCDIPFPILLSPLFPGTVLQTSQSGLGYVAIPGQAHITQKVALLTFFFWRFHSTLSSAVVAVDGFLSLLVEAAYKLCSTGKIPYSELRVLGHIQCGSYLGKHFTTGAMFF